ncbi:DUF4931 domain-containing protein [Pullulanibacillus camelliae]|uniref:DUF4931 domain-containing protein n=1 Tax=Pullulanibacillus camelliae TaxID=1707096 RepID=A0A8J2YII2_9BACL|nr:DUF4931 domain-containing protein [Pullulanibacillus camelliae]GGE44955.1 DUF4931 domain-containing protein [Pullulanibacillus camelliae]
MEYVQTLRNVVISLSDDQILHFNPMIAKEKPNSVHHNSLCPFCAKDQLDEIIDTRDNMILVKNKYPVLEETFPTVLIETDECQSELADYALPHLYNLMAFAFEKWLEMENNERFKSVIFFKNQGPLSGGSIRHPHMQIIGLEKVDYHDNLKEEFFVGHRIIASDTLEVNLSTHPMIGFTEFNIRFTDLDQLHEVARSVQSICHYILNRFNGGSCRSYNIFFYHWLDVFYVKIIPRYVTTPLYVGFGLRQTYNNPEAIIDDLRQHYFYQPESLRE